MCATDAVEKSQYDNWISRTNGNPSIIIDNGQIIIRINRQNASVEAIYDHDHGILYEMSGIGFVVHTDRGEMVSNESIAIHWLDDGVKIIFVFAGFEIDVYYSLGSGQKFYEKWIEIKPVSDYEYFIQKIILEDVCFKSAVKEIHFHDDQTIWHCPINLFVRSENGGCFAGIEYPYWDMTIHKADGYALGYEPKYPAKAGEVNVSEKYFFGVYQYEGIDRYSHGPYPGELKADYYHWEKSGLSQHFKDGHIPDSAVNAETLDWGEVWAMQSLMSYVLPEQPLPEDGYWIWQNGWWAGLFELDHQQLDTLKEAGIHDVMTAHTWYGHDTHPNTEPSYISNMQSEPLRFPVPIHHVNQDNQLSAMDEQWHKETNKNKPNYSDCSQFEVAFRAPKAFEDYIGYGESIGVKVSSFSLPNIYFYHHPEWGLIDQSGKPGTYLFGSRVSCPACDEYMDFLFELYRHVFDQYSPRWWGWDGRWLSYWEVVLPPNHDVVRPDPCFASTHGHEPGDNCYREWKNIMNLLKKIRTRYSHMCLEQYYGLKRGGPWALKYFNSDENYYESNGPVSNRLQAWHNQNDHFRPAYYNHSSIFGGTIEEFRYNVISSISISSYCQIGHGFKALGDPENRMFLKKWRSWASENHRYLKVKRDLSGCPGYVPIDGSAHIIKDRGYIFLFSAIEPENIKQAEVHHDQIYNKIKIQLNNWLGLQASPDVSYQINEIYPNQQLLGVYPFGSEWTYSMPLVYAYATIISIEPVSTNGDDNLSLGS